MVFTLNYNFSQVLKPLPSPLLVTQVGGCCFFCVLFVRHSMLLLFFTPFFNLLFLQSFIHLLFFFNFVVTCDILSQAYLLCFSLCLFLSFLLGRSSCLFSAFFSSTSSWKIHWQLRFKMGVELNVIFSLKHFHHPTCHASSYSSV